MKWNCEWCHDDPKDTAAKHPERCQIRFCPKCETKTMHWTDGKSLDTPIANDYSVKIITEESKMASATTKAKPERKPSQRQERLLKAFGGIGKPVALKDLGNIAFKRERSEAKRFSWARNNIRWLLKQKFVQRVGKKGDGKYQRIARD